MLSGKNQVVTISCIFPNYLLKLPQNGIVDFGEELVVNWGLMKLMVRNDDCW